MRNPPLDVLWSWPPPNFIDPEENGSGTLFGVCSTLIALAVVAVALRLYVRIGILHNTGWDDWLILAALVPSTGLTATSMLGTKYGWGYHIWDNRLEWFKPSLLLSWISQLFFLLTMILVKLSICYSYRRLSLEKPFKCIVKGSMVFIVIWGISFVVTAVFRCWPIDGYWVNITMKEADCIPEEVPLMASSVSNIFSDFWLVLLPVPTLWRLQLPTRQRIILISLMALGIVACACGIARTVYLYQTLYDTYDVTWEGYYVWLWTMAECDLAIVCTSVPPLRPLIKRHFPRVLDKRRSLTVETSRSTPLALLSKRRASNFSTPASPTIRSPINKPCFDLEVASIKSVPMSASVSCKSDPDGITPTGSHSYA